MYGNVMYNFGLKWHFDTLTLNSANDLDLGTPKSWYYWIASINEHMSACLNYIYIFPGSRNIE